MRSSSRLAVILVLMLVTVVLAGARIQAWNPATHIYIAQKVYPAFAQLPDLWYGAIAPDMAMYVPEGYGWDSAFWDTHWTVTDLRPWAWNSAQRAFAKGWVTHNEMYAADHYAHGFPPFYLAGYITFRANLLAAAANISPELAHYAIETAVDLRLQNDRHYPAGLLLSVAANPPSYVQSLLTRVFVWWPFQRTDVQSLRATQAYFNRVVLGYANALNNSRLDDYDAMVDFGYLVAHEIDSSVTPEEVAQLLGAALQLCADYDVAINLTIKAVSASVPR